MMALMGSRSQPPDRRQKTRVDGRDTTRVPTFYCRACYHRTTKFTRVLFGLLSRECTIPHKTRKIDNSLVPLETPEECLDAPTAIKDRTVRMAVVDFIFLLSSKDAAGSFANS